MTVGVRFPLSLDIKCTAILYLTIFDVSLAVRVMGLVHKTCLQTVTSVQTGLFYDTFGLANNHTEIH